ncbi:Tad domain-containing protein [Neobacillus sp. WH10]|uniref:Tad domain-containing protein n=1 Tax=Neobacillus sp. WH10 TaxID=3047873 RepID=UPI0024C0F9DD|nr:Tad domain-containing protein [Neobacillus sp. WH10]WHY76781.1 Tad domain-containing protein [Neobacillus sp. WH10]
MKRLFRLLKLKGENGASLVIVALSMVALLGFTALAIDGGRLYSEKSKLQKALDSTVLAGAQGLRTSEARAIEIAKDISDKNGYKVSESELTLTNSSIKATKKVNVPMTFAKVIGVNNTTVSATAKAVVLPLKKASGVAPIAIEKDAIVPGSTALNCGSDTGNNKGNCGFLRFDENGAQALKDAIINGGTYAVDDKVVETEPGAMVGQVKDAIDTLIAMDKDKPHCKSAATADNSCARVITIVVIDTWVGANGQTERKVVGLASYWIEGMQGKAIIGQFIQEVDAGEIGNGTEIGEYNLYGVKLEE